MTAAQYSPECRAFISRGCSSSVVCADVGGAILAYRKGPDEEQR